MPGVSDSTPRISARGSVNWVHEAPKRWRFSGERRSAFATRHRRLLPVPPRRIPLDKLRRCRAANTCVQALAAHFASESEGDRSREDVRRAAVRARGYLWVSEPTDKAGADADCGQHGRGEPQERLHGVTVGLSMVRRTADSQVGRTAWVCRVRRRPSDEASDAVPRTSAPRTSPQARCHRSGYVGAHALSSMPKSDGTGKLNGCLQLLHGVLQVPVRC